MEKHNLLKVLLISLTLAFTSPLQANSILSPLTDSVNSGIINTKILGNDSLSHANIDATVINGIAIFSGEVRTTAQREELIRIARSVSGITGVNTSKLKVSTQAN